MAQRIRKQVRTSGSPTGKKIQFDRSIKLAIQIPKVRSVYVSTSYTTTKTLICPGWETAVVPVSQPGTPVRDKRGCPFVPGVATGTKEDLLSRLVTPTGTKGAASAHVAGAPFCPGWCYQLVQKVSFFHVFLFSILFLFQLYFCISIKLMYWNSVCMISTNIYIYI